MSKTPINMILKWLAVADMFVMIEYIPFSYFHYIAAGKLQKEKSERGTALRRVARE